MNYREVSESFSIIDPLYEVSRFGVGMNKDLYSEFFGAEESFENLYLELINTYEMNRLNFLKQAGLLFLIFPSATHTRFSHSLGCFILGSYALTSILVKEGGETVTLEEYLNQKNSLEEFLIALLVHDIGHLPFSHYLEASQKVKDFYGNHEKITEAFLTEGTKLHEILSKHAGDKDTNTITQVCKKYSNINMDKLIGFLTGSSTPGDSISQLITGYLDLDRLDHYYRDSFFMGLKLASINVRGFLDAIVLVIDKDGNSQFFLRKEGIPHVLHLLFGREMLWQRAFDNDFNRAYQAMLIKAFDKWIQENEVRLIDLPFMTEDELITELYSCDDSRSLFERIMMRKPYFLAYKAESSMSEKEVKESFSYWLRKRAKNDTDFLLFMPKNYKKEDFTNEWLLSNIRIYEGGDLRGTHSELIYYFLKQHQKRNSTIRVYAKDRKLADQVRDELKDIFGR